MSPHPFVCLCIGTENSISHRQDFRLISYITSIKICWHISISVTIAHRRQTLHMNIYVRVLQCQLNGTNNWYSTVCGARSEAEINIECLNIMLELSAVNDMCHILWVILPDLLQIWCYDMDQSCSVCCVKCRRVHLK